MSPPLEIVGIDTSATGTALVSGESYGAAGVGKVKVLYFADTVKGYRERADEGATPPLVRVAMGDERAALERLDLVLALVRGGLVHGPDYVAMEDYALAKRAFMERVAEVAGCVKHILMKSGSPFRLYPPENVKKFTTGKWQADKPAMIAACLDRWGFDAMRYGKKPTGAAGNVADAYSIFRMLHCELCIRSGEVDLRDLREHERQAFLRTTKRHPTCVITSDFVQREE